MKYEVVLECEIDGTVRTPGDIGEHPEEVVNELIKEGKIRVLPEGNQTSDPSTSTDQTPPDQTPVDNSQTSNQETMPNDNQDSTSNNSNSNQTDGSVNTDTNQPTDAQRVIAQTDLDTNPILGELSAEVGDTVSVKKQ